MVGHPQHLAVDRDGVLGGGRVLGVAGGGVERPVRAEGQPAAVVVLTARDAGEDRLGAPRAAVVGHPHDAVVRVGGEVGVNECGCRRTPGRGPGRADPSRRPRRGGCGRRAGRPRAPARGDPDERRRCRARRPARSRRGGRRCPGHRDAVTTVPATCGSGSGGGVAPGVVAVLGLAPDVSLEVADRLAGSPSGVPPSSSVSRRWGEERRPAPPRRTVWSCARPCDTVGSLGLRA